MSLLDKFLKYVNVETTSDATKQDTPSTKNQLVLAKLLVQELNELNVDEIFFDEKHCYVYAKLKGDESLPKIGFLSHLDTSPDASGKNIKPKIVYNYDGEDVFLNKDVVLSINDYADLKSHIGKTLITTDGTTLLGADDKSGIVEIMQMLKRIQEENIKHGDLLICFTPDEEIGLGTLNINYDIFNPDFAYTVDGSDLGEISYENFNAATAKIRITGNATHTGSAKGKMVNAVRIASEIDNLLPNEIPENTEGYEGFFHLEKIDGNVTYAESEYLIRDFDKEKFNTRKKILTDIVNKFNEKFNNCLDLSIKDTYYNMANIIGDNLYIIERTKEAMREVNVEPIIKPIRGGTDGARITYNGIICPNLGTGAHNFHSVYEYVLLDDMEKNVDILVSIVKKFSNDRIKELKYDRN